MTAYQLNVNGERRDVKRRSVHSASLGLARRAQDDRTKIRLRDQRLRRVHGAYRRRGDALVRFSPVSAVGDRPIVTIEGIGRDPVGRACRTPGWRGTSCNAATARAGRS